MRSSRRITRPRATSKILPRLFLDKKSEKATIECMAHVESQRISERRRLSNRRTLLNLYNAAGSDDMSKAELSYVGIPEEFHEAVLEECRAIRELYSNGDRGLAHQRANQAALIALETFGDRLEPKVADPDELARQVVGDAVDPTDENDPRALAERIPRGF